MTLNLKQIARTVKFSPTALVPNPASPLGQSAAYRQLKTLGWTCVNSEIHPTDRVPVFRLRGAAIRRHPSGYSQGSQRSGSGWIVDVAGGQYERTGCLQQITAEAVALDAAAAEPERIPTDDETDGPRNLGESIMELNGEDYKAARRAAKQRVTMPTSAQAQAALDFALNPGRANRAMPSRAEFKVNYGGGR